MRKITAILALCAVPALAQTVRVTGLVCTEVAPGVVECVDPNTPPCTDTLLNNLIGYWALDEVSGSRADSHGNLSLTEVGGVVSSTTGKVGNAALFDGTTYLRRLHETAITINDEDFSIAGWFNIPSLGTTHQQIFSKGNEWYLRLTGFGWRDFVTDHVDHINGTPDITGGAHFFYAEYDTSVDNKIRIRMDDGAFIETPITSPVDSAPASNLEIGAAFSGAQPMVGWVDEVGFWRRKLTSIEQSNLWNTGNGTTYPFTCAQ